LEFRLRQTVASVKNASIVGKIVEIGLPTTEGIPWIMVRFGSGKGRWELGDGYRAYKDLSAIPVPDGVVVLKRVGHAPDVYQQPGSKATQEECESFLSAIQRMFLSSGSK
jgi:hypothetical protein